MTELDKKLFDAVQDGDLELVRELVGQGADVNARDDDDSTILHLAAYLQSKMK